MTTTQHNVGDRSQKLHNDLRISSKNDYLTKSYRFKSENATCVQKSLIRLSRKEIAISKFGVGKRDGCKGRIYLSGKGLKY